MISKEQRKRRSLRDENAELRARLSQAESHLAQLQASPRAASQVGNAANAGFALQHPSLVSQGNEGVVTLTANGIILYSNSQFSGMMEMPVEKVIGKSFFGFVRFGWNERFFEFLQKSLGGSQTAEIALSTKAGNELVALLVSNPFSTDGKTGVSLSVADITRKSTEEALRRTAERLETVAELTTDAVWELDVAKDELWRSDGFAALLGYSPQAVKPTQNWWKQSVHPDDRSVVFGEIERILKAGEGHFRETYRLRKADGTYAEVIDQAIAIRDERTNSFRLIGSIVDVTEQNRAEAAKREISKQILDAEEKERQRVARELHDGVNQLLSSSTYRLSSVEQQISMTDQALAKKVCQAKDLVNKAIAEVRLISRNLRPSELDDLGLNAALRSLCSEFEERTGIEVQLEAETFGKVLPPGVELTIYRIAQEALNNVQKHADAKHVRISLVRDVKSVRMKIADDGKGFDQTQPGNRTKSGWGLANMRQRALLFGGNVLVKTASAGGTQIELSIPIS